MAASPLLRSSRVFGRIVSLVSRGTKRSVQTELSSPASRTIQSRISRPSTCSRCLTSMLPLHSAIASARLRSALSAESQPWGCVPQGMSMPL